MNLSFSRQRSPKEAVPHRTHARPAVPGLEFGIRRQHVDVAVLSEDPLVQLVILVKADPEVQMQLSVEGDALVVGMAASAEPRGPIAGGPRACVPEARLEPVQESSRSLEHGRIGHVALALLDALEWSDENPPVGHDSASDLDHVTYAWLGQM